MATAEISPTQKLAYQFSSILGAVLIPQEDQYASLARIAGEAPAPGSDEEVRAEALRAAYMILEIERSADNIEDRIKALRDKKAAAQRLADMLRADLTDMMIKSGVNSARDTEIEVFTRNNPDKIEYSDELLAELSLCRPEFVRTKREIDKAALTKHYKETGEILDGMEIVPGGHSVTIKR